MKKAKFAMLLVMLMTAVTVFGQNTEFTYQGQLQNSSTPATGVFDFEFALFDTSLGGAQIGSTTTRSGVSVTSGIFSVNLDFGQSFPGGTRFLEIRVRQSGGGSFTTLAPRQLVSSAPYSVKSLNADTAQNALTAATATNATNAVNATNATNAANAANATNAVTAANFTGPLAGDVTGTQSSTTVARLRGTNVATTSPTNNQVLKFNSASGQWQPATDETGGGGGGGTITGVTAGTGLTGGGTTGTVTVGVANGGIGNSQLADGSVNNAKITDVAGGKITGSITTATIPGANVSSTVANATIATNFTGTLAGDVTGTQNATSIAPNAVTDAKIAPGQVVKSLNSLRDNVNLAAGANVTITPSGNTLTIASIGGGGNAILNQTNQQAGANFNISGDGTAGGTLSGGVVNAVTRYNLNGNRILSNPGNANLFVGSGTGQNGSQNVFVGSFAGQNNTTGSSNSFVGWGAGRSNTLGGDNTFVGIGAGQDNLGGDFNAFFGASSGLRNQSGGFNSFFGVFSGQNNVSGSSNTFVGKSAGVSNTTASNNSFFGADAGSENTIGASNAFFGYEAGRSNTTAPGNSFFGALAGRNTTGGRNSFFGRAAGANNTTGQRNSFFGEESGVANTSGIENSFFGINSGDSNTTGSDNAFFGAVAGNDNTTGDFNVFMGSNSGGGNSIGSSNSFFGTSAGAASTTGNNNTFIGRSAGSTNTSGSSNTILGHDSDVGSAGLSFATAIGAGAIATENNSVWLGRTADIVYVPGFLRLQQLGGAGATALCRNNANTIGTCSSSLRYKSNIGRFSLGLSLVNQLKPITFDWKDGGMHDLGLGAEDVAAIEPLLVTYNDKGQVEGVKYDRIGVVLVNAVKEQQVEISGHAKTITNLNSRIEDQARQIAELKAALCAVKADLALCKPIK